MRRPNTIIDRAFAAVLVTNSSSNKGGAPLFALAATWAMAVGIGSLRHHTVCPNDVLSA